MKDKLCFRKYKNNCILFGAFLLISLCLCLLMENTVGYLGLVLSVLGFGSVVAYNLYAYISYKNKSQNMTPSVGTISNWRISGYRNHWGCVILELGGKEYCSPNYFGAYEAEEMVGKEVSYIIIDDTLLIYNILN